MKPYVRVKVVRQSAWIMAGKNKHMHHTHWGLYPPESCKTLDEKCHRSLEPETG